MKERNEAGLIDGLKANKPESVIDLGDLTAFELLQIAAELLDKQDGPRAKKFYRNLAAQVRQLAARL